MPSYLDTCSLDFVERGFILGAIVQLQWSAGTVRGDLLRMLKCPIVLHVCRDACCSKCVTAGGVGQGGLPWPVV